jgi:hypothetical protein
MNQSWDYGTHTGEEFSRRDACERLEEQQALWPARRSISWRPKEESESTHF